MGISILPKNVKFFELFKQQSQMLEDAACCLVELFTPESNVEELCGKINRLEDECHELVRAINHELYRNFLTPLDREDIYSISRKHHDVIYLIKAISIRIGLFNLPSITSAALEMTKILNSMVKEIHILIEGLEKIKDMDETVNKIEGMRKEGATMVRLAYAELYEGPRETPGDVLYVLQWTQIYDLLLNAIEKTETLATVIEGIILKNG